jgi:two-component system chemotaxis response regulator CheY
MNAKVLVVDDSLMVRQQVKRALVTAGFDVVEAQDGIDALEKAKATPDVALVICDVNMPRMGGLDFLEAFRQDERFKAVPVVMLTTEAQSELVARSKALGAKGWIIKPFKPELLTAAAKRLAIQPAAA